MIVDEIVRYKERAMQLNNRFKFAGKTILDLGCGEGGMAKEIAAAYNPSFVSGVDVNNISEEGENYKLANGDARNLPFEDNSFDLVYSISTFEHINGIPETLAEVRRVLKPRGKFYLSFCPLWTSVCGHHCYSYSGAFSKGFSGDRDEKIVWGIPAWGHLYLSKDEMGQHLSANGFEDDVVFHILDYVYELNDINRRTASETKHDIVSSGMIVRGYSEGIAFSRHWALDQRGESELTDEIINKIKATKYNINDIGITYMKAELEKYESISFR